MRLVWELTSRSVQRYITYRAATLAGLATNFFFGLLRAAVLLALYGARPEVAGYTIAGIITYTALTQAVIGYLSLFNWDDLMRSVYSGDVASDLLKPMPLFTFWMAQDLGRAVVALLFRGVGIMVLYALLFDLSYPDQPQQWLALLLAVILGWLISFSWRFTVNLAAFWTPNAVGILRFAFMLSWFFSGFLMPLRFYPDWVVLLSRFTPFPYMINTVIEIYLGLVRGPELAGALVLQGIWAMGLILVAHLLVRLGIRRLEILGG